ncbi:MAG: HlyD family efflux transporter periplasmic adaptor subunit [Candidatus Marinimicrobia bacterium]|jgi:cobalt-zinc-cadmium efflux system membrane fusion protein|nr:HlyD family efflux transporter periplasmic adaptor subunit [Candidatus Neomarinimicrobiota bacterium]MBT3632747.1 HlyD family efflux transporter periplasmic adaptor subunit [Candidatus Neomarinimicrobiota bacterium]MBT3681857.1 HlyD family efflux transporter periplasmic adaptor subunit [Candidatus Neomarinimicrobiota bacterium]MBT3760510.1 HlyD family efflux transporter periplasmic adaptor subunit [Candidatus Neomarinimicrobiota bacterium]MBT3896656.1 HlyD family efflux transporter periplasm
MIKKLFRNLLLTLIAFTFWQCNNDHNLEHDGHENHSETGETHSEHDELEGHEDHDESEEIDVIISDKEMKEFGIITQIAGGGELQLHVNLTGEIIIPPDNLAHIYPRFDGIVKKVLKSVGDKVTIGEVLAIIESNESLSEYEVKSLIKGTVIEKHLTQGEVINDSDHGFVIADLQTVWAQLQIFQKDLPYIKIGQKVEVSAGKGFTATNGSVSYISPVIDERTRTATCRIILDNQDDMWRPGLFINGRVTTVNILVNILIPKTAVEIINGENVIFVRAHEGFSPRHISIGRINDKTLEVIDGLKPGEEFISTGGFTLKAELQKSEFGDGHAH